MLLYLSCSCPGSQPSLYVKNNPGEVYELKPVRIVQRIQPHPFVYYFYWSGKSFELSVSVEAQEEEEEWVDSGEYEP